MCHGIVAAHRFLQMYSQRHVFRARVSAFYMHARSCFQFGRIDDKACHQHFGAGGRLSLAVATSVELDKTFGDLHVLGTRLRPTTYKKINHFNASRTA